MLGKPIENLGLNSNSNLDNGSKTCPIVREGRGLGEGIIEGNMSKAAQSSALLAMYNVPGGA